MNRNRLARRMACALTIAALTVGAAGCSDDNGVTPTKTAPTATEPSTSASTSVTPTATATPNETPNTPVPIAHTDKAAVAKYGQDAIDALPDEMATIVALSLGSPDLASGDIEPVDVVGALPLTGDAAKRAARFPTELTMDTLGGDLTPVAPYAAPQRLDTLTVRYGLDKVDGDTLLRVAFTGQGRVWFDQDDKTSTGDYSRDYILWLTPSASADGPNWFVADYNTQAIQFADPVRAE